VAASMVEAPGHPACGFPSIVRLARPPRFDGRRLAAKLSPAPTRSGADVNAALVLMQPRVGHLDPGPFGGRLHPRDLCDALWPGWWEPSPGRSTSGRSQLGLLPPCRPPPPPGASRRWTTPRWQKVWPGSATLYKNVDGSLRGLLALFNQMAAPGHILSWSVPRRLAASRTPASMSTWP